MRSALLLLAATCSVATAQIYADFDVSQGGNPLGSFRVRLEHEKTPRTCANFIGLATGRRPWIEVTTGRIRENTPYYDGLTFHRLIHNFVIQGGSPNGAGTDSPGYSILDEYDGTLRHSGRYLLSMAKSSLPNTGGSQFFITLAASPHLDDKHSIFGEVISGREIIDGFTNSTLFPTGSGNRPVTAIRMDSVTISGPDYEAFDLDATELKLPSIRGVSLSPTRDTAASTFTTGFARHPHHEYLNSYSMDLTTWAAFRHILSIDSKQDEVFVTNSVTFPRFFMRMADIDYGHLINAPADLNQNGRKIRIIARDGTWVQLTLGGGTTGSWTDSLGGSGTLTGVSWTDSAPASGLYSAANAQAYYLPLGTLQATFSSPAGSKRWKSLSQTTLSFHTSGGGWVEGTATTNSDALAVNQSFILVP